MDSTAKIIKFKTDQSQIGTRHRKPRSLKSCLVCRQKKIKCDGTRPACGACLKRDLPDLCKYQGIQWSVQLGTSLEKHTEEYDTAGLKFQGIINTSSINNNDQIKNLPSTHRFIDVNPLNYDNEPIDLYHNKFPASAEYSQGVLTWMSLLRKDVFLNSIAISSQRARELIGRAKRQNQKDNQILKRWKSEDPNGNFKSAKFLDIDELIKELETVLSDKKLVWILVEKFFVSEFFMLMPLLDKAEYVGQLSRIIGDKKSPKKTLDIQKKTDLAIIGILLIIMRLTSLSGYNFGKRHSRPFESEDIYIMKNPITTCVMKLVQKIDTELSNFKAPKLDIFQFLAMKVHYDFYGPEQSDCVKIADSANIGQLLQYASRCSLNRDPTSSNILPPSRKNNLLRRLWFEVVYLDAYQMLFAGCPSLIDSKFYDTHFPHLDESTDDFDYAVSEWFYERSRVYEICHPLVESLLNIRTHPTIGKIKEQLKPLLSYISELKSLKEIMKSPSDTLVQRCNKLKESILLIDCSSMVYMIYYHFALFYNDRNDTESTIFYALEMFKIGRILFEFSLFLYPNSTEYDFQKHYGNGATIFPRIEAALHKISQLMLSILSRIKAMKLLSGSKGLDPEMTEVVDHIIDDSNRTIAFILTGFLNVSNTYYHPWIVSKIQSFIMKYVLNIPKGEHYILKNKIDDEFIKTIRESKGEEDNILTFSAANLKKIHNELSKFKEVFDSACSTKSTKDLGVHLDEAFVAEIEKTWFEQMHHDYRNGEDYESKVNNSATTERDHAMEVNLKDEIDIANGFNTDDKIREELLSLDDLINANLDLIDMDNIFTYGPGDNNPF